MFKYNLLGAEEKYFLALGKIYGIYVIIAACTQLKCSGELLSYVDQFLNQVEHKFIRSKTILK